MSGTNCYVVNIFENDLPLIRFNFLHSLNTGGIVRTFKTFIKNQYIGKLYELSKLIEYSHLIMSP